MVKIKSIVVEHSSLFEHIRLSSTHLIVLCSLETRWQLRSNMCECLPFKIVAQNYILKGKLSSRKNGIKRRMFGKFKSNYLN